MACPECEAQQREYGFALELGGKYMTKVDEIKACCPVEVEVVSFTTLDVKFTYRNKEYKMNKKQFMQSSWRKYDSV